MNAAAAKHAHAIAKTAQPTPSNGESLANEYTLIATHPAVMPTLNHGFVAESHQARRIYLTVLNWMISHPSGT